MPAAIFCRDPLTPGKADPHFAPAAAAFREAGAAVALIDHDALVAGDAAGAVRRVPVGLGAAWYRGWMVTAAQYRALSKALEGRGCVLLTDAAAYRTAHELPGWYPGFAEVTPASGWLPHTPGEPLTGLDAIAASLGTTAAIVKDHVKSCKHEWDTACFVPDVTDGAALHRVASAFVGLRGDDLAGGVVLRAFEDFVPPADGGGEARVWWLDGEPVAVTAHPDTPANRPEPDLGAVRGPVSRLPARFVTTDMALRTDGVWRVVEVGDGQVSDLRQGADLGAFVRILAAGQAPLRAPAASGTTPL
ncbi:MAG TPA: ATP-grasp domain-containing protein [Phytomonospora sp.]